MLLFKKISMKTLFLFFLVISFNLFGQIEAPYSWRLESKDSKINVYHQKIDNNTIENALEQDSKGKYAVAINERKKIEKKDFSLSYILDNNDRIYQYRVVSNEIKGFMFTLKFTNIGQSKIWFYNQDHSKFYGPFTKEDLQFDSTILSPIMSGNDWIIEVLEKQNASSNHFFIDNISSFFRGVKSSAGFGTSDDCMINVNCTESNNYKKVVSSTVKMVVTSGSVSYFCTGNIINNTKLDGTPYVLSANHCSLNSSSSDYPNWIFIFSFEFPACANLSVEPVIKQLKGCSLVAQSGNDGGDISSDFMLLKIKSSIPDAWNINFIGWDRSGSATSSGVCLHHPDGDVKKISTYNTAPTISSYGRFMANTHFRVFWASTQSGKGVTQGGSSGSGLINSSGLLIGTLTGGGSNCIDNSMSDFYGRFSMHWDKFGTNNVDRLKPWLDPLNLGVTTLSTFSKSSVSISSNQDLNSIKVNWFQNSLNIESSADNYDVELYNVNGQWLESYINNKYNSKIEIPELSKGIYFANIISSNYTKSFKFVVQ